MVYAFNFNTKSTSQPNSQNETATSETITPSSKIQEILFEELLGKYKGNIDDKEITITIFLEGTSKKYTYSENKNSRLSDNFCGKSLVGIFKMYFLFCSSLYRRSDLNKISIFTCFSAYFNLVRPSVQTKLKLGVTKNKIITKIVR